jgi:hypothetical protein
MIKSIHSNEKNEMESECNILEKIKNQLNRFTMH